MPELFLCVCRPSCHSTRPSSDRQPFKRLIYPQRCSPAVLPISSMDHLHLAPADRATLPVSSHHAVVSFHGTTTPSVLHDDDRHGTASHRRPLHSTSRGTANHCMACKGSLCDHAGGVLCALSTLHVTENGARCLGSFQPWLPAQ